MAGLSKDISGKVLASFLPIMTFVTGGFEHCVANMFIITEAIIAKAHYLAAAGGDLQTLSNMLHGVSVEQLQSLNWGNFLVKNLIPVTLGNVVGGLFFVGLVGFMVNKFDMKKD